MKEKWENVDDGGGCYRLKVPNGWLVRYGNSALCFVIDSGHYWGMTDEELKFTKLKERETYLKQLEKEIKEGEPDFGIEAP